VGSLPEDGQMKIFDLSRYACCVCTAAAMLAGCGGSQPISNAVIPPVTGAVTRDSASVSHLDGRKSWMSRDAKKIKMLLYVASRQPPNQIFVYDYKTGKLVGWLDFGKNFNTGLAGLCVDKTGDVWTTLTDNSSDSSSVVEFSHGGSKPLRTLTTDGLAIGCSIDPTSGDLAVANWETRSGPADLQVFDLASGTPRDYTIAACAFMTSPGYDGNGNLYVEGEQDPSGANTVCELPHNAAAMRSVSFNVQIGFEPGVMWDGKYITLGATEVPSSFDMTIFQMKQDASGNLTEAGQTVLTDNGCPFDGASVTQPFIVGSQNTPVNRHQGAAVVGGNSSIYCVYRFGYWKYPAGGNPDFALDDAPAISGGQAVSIAVRR
jgi:hypothetical protein